MVIENSCRNRESNVISPWVSMQVEEGRRQDQVLSHLAVRAQMVVEVVADVNEGSEQLTIAR